MSKLFRGGLIEARLNGANFSQADLRQANIIRSDLTRTWLDNAKLHGAELRDVNLSDATLHKTDFGNATISKVKFANNDLSEVIGLETIQHKGPSTIGLDTIYLSKGDIPDALLRGAGVPDNFIEYMRSLTGKAFEFYSCFISYSSKNQPFADRLYSDMQSKGIRCWFAPEDLRIGDKTRLAIDESIRKHDKLLLILSKYSVNSNWVEQEVETALAREREENRLVLFPIRLDNSVMEINSGWPALIKNTRNIGDFRKWKDHDAYQNAFQRLMRDLKAQS